ncbi:MAG: hypothetical protein IK031_06920 [Bacteroidales bacterium]|nr:hypothetical protein [Bacteroidales bacterium]
MRCVRTCHFRTVPCGKIHSYGNDDSWLDNFDPTKDFYGKHGEFDRNDEKRKECENIQDFHINHPDVELTDHFDWSDVLEAETDGYLDD